MQKTLSYEQANQIDTTEEIQTGFESAKFSDSENQAIHDEYFVHKNTEIWIPGHDKNIYKAKVFGHENNRPRVHYENWNRKYETTFDSYSVWIYLQLVEKLKQHPVMTDEVNNLIQNAFENHVQFRFESSSGLTQDLARLNLGDNIHTDNILSNAEKEPLMKEIFPLKNTNYSVPHENEVLWEDRWNTVCTRRCKFYRLPTGKIGKQYVEMLNCELEMFLKSNIPSEQLLVFSALILHRDNKVRHSNDVKITIENRMKGWSVEKFQSLVQSYKRRTQFSSKAVRTQKSDPEEKLRAFAKMVEEGNIKSATRFLADKNESSVLKPSDLTDGRTVAKILQEKQPKASLLFEETFNISELPPLEKLNITSSTIEKQARKLFGSSGPSGSDANHWFDALIRCGLESSRLRELVSQLGNLIANEIISWRKIKALFSCRLIALDKQPGVRPIGIGETLQRLLNKAIADLTGDDLAYAFGSEKLAGGVS